jgi:dephospho-CoA kinase
MAIVITGCIGSGKSRLMSALATKFPDYKFCNMDNVVKQLYADPSIRQYQINNFMSTDKRTISDIAFKNPAVLSNLERFMMPYIRKEAYEWFKEPKVIIEFPMYFEMLHALPDIQDKREETLVVTVASTDETRKARVLARDGITEEKFNRIEDRQWLQLKKMVMADGVVWNHDGSTDKQIIGQFNDILEKWNDDKRHSSRIV